ncbi:hypothetical protein ABIE64_000400 [Thalassospira sp. MBR-102]|uniref:hypothetical protein n=1 Tax=Thalassospira sp. MBR-102 TaxID=3156466 RepID=UPI003391B5C1
MSEYKPTKTLDPNSTEDDHLSFEIEMLRNKIENLEEIVKALSLNAGAPANLVEDWLKAPTKGINRTVEEIKGRGKLVASYIKPE